MQAAPLNCNPKPKEAQASGPAPAASKLSQFLYLLAGRLGLRALGVVESSQQGNNRIQAVYLYRLQRYHTCGTLGEAEGAPRSTKGRFQLRFRV